jgi:hypothetical protein
MNEADIPLCTDCKHFNCRLPGQFCERPIGSDFSPVDGRRTITLSVPAEQERRANRRWWSGRPRCGPLGRYFQHAGAKAPPPPADDD